MNERTFSRGLSSSVVDALKSHGHILVVKGGAASLARELDEIIAPALAVVTPHLATSEARAPRDQPRPAGDEGSDRAVEELVARLTRALMSSDHVEDVFAEDAVIRREILRAVRDGVLSPSEAIAEDRSTVVVKLDTLGYVAATVSKRADAVTLRQALDRAAAASSARFTAYSAEPREAVFRVDGGGPDERLDLEEAVADELTDLADRGVVELPTVERRIELDRALSAAEQRAIGARIEAAAESTLLRSGCAAAWQFADARSIRITFTPLSEQDAEGVDAPTSAFEREIAGLLATTEPRPPKRERAAEVEPGAAAAARAIEPVTDRAASGPKADAAAPSSRRKPRVKQAAPAAAPARPKRASSVEEAAPSSAAGKRKRAAGEGTRAPVKATTPSPRSGAAPRSSAKRAAPTKTKAPTKKG